MPSPTLSSSVEEWDYVVCGLRGCDCSIYLSSVKWFCSRVNAALEKKRQFYKYSLLFRSGNHMYPQLITLPFIVAGANIISSFNWKTLHLFVCLFTSFLFPWKRPNISLPMVEYLHVRFSFVVFFILVQHCWKGFLQMEVLIFLLNFYFCFL